VNRHTAIRSVTRKEFDKYAPARSVIATVVLQEIEWFVDEDGVVIGFVARDKSDNDWSLYMLKRLRNTWHS
jgi:hypothetical protein